MRHRYWTLGGLLLFGLVLRLTRYWQELFLSRDGYSYLFEVKKLTYSGDWAALFQQHAYSGMPPGFFWLLMGGEFCGANLILTGMLWVLFCGIMLIVAAYWAVLGFSNRVGYALGAALLAATNPDLIRLGSTILRDVPYCACALIAVGSGIWAVRTRRFWYWLLFTGAAAAAILIRKEGFELMLIVAVWCALALPVQLWRRNWRGMGFVLGSTVLVLGVLLLLLLPLEFHFAANYQSQWEVIPHTWAGYIRSMFFTALKN